MAHKDGGIAGNITRLCGAPAVRGRRLQEEGGSKTPRDIRKNEAAERQKRRPLKTLKSSIKKPEGTEARWPSKNGVKIMRVIDRIHFAMEKAENETFRFYVCVSVWFCGFCCCCCFSFLVKPPLTASSYNNIYILMFWRLRFRFFLSFCLPSFLSPLPLYFPSWEWKGCWGWRENILYFSPFGFSAFYIQREFVSTNLLTFYLPKEFKP